MYRHFENNSTISYTRVTFYISEPDKPSIAICQLTALSQSLTFLKLYVLSMFWHTSAICIVYSNLRIHLAQNMELNREHFRAFIFYNFRRGLTQQQRIDET